MIHSVCPLKVQKYPRASPYLRVFVCVPMRVYVCVTYCLLFRSFEYLRSLCHGARRLCRKQVYLHDFWFSVATALPRLLMATCDNINENRQGKCRTTWLGYPLCLPAGNCGKKAFSLRCPQKRRPQLLRSQLWCPQLGAKDRSIKDWI